MKTNLTNENGDISEYGFACGYVQKFEGRFGYLKLYKEFHTYHLIKTENLKPAVWLSFDKLGPARKAFTKFKKEMLIQSERFLFASDAKSFQRKMRRLGYSTQSEHHLGVEHPDHVIKVYLKKPQLRKDLVLVTKENQEGINMFYHLTCKNRDKTPLRARRNGKTKTWKTRPNDFKIPVKYGLRDCFYITQYNCHEWTIN